MERLHFSRLLWEHQQAAPNSNAHGPAFGTGMTWTDKHHGATPGSTGAMASAMIHKLQAPPICLMVNQRAEVLKVVVVY